MGKQQQKKNTQEDVPLTYSHEREANTDTLRGLGWCHTIRY